MTVTPEKAAEYRARWRARNPDYPTSEARKQAQARWAAKRGKQWKRQRAEMLTDAYLRKVLTSHSSLTASDIPETLVALKRVQLAVARFIKEKSN